MLLLKNKNDSIYIILFNLITSRARVKSGLRILGVDASSDSWNVTSDVNVKQKIATVTCVRKETADDVQVEKT